MNVRELETDSRLPSGEWCGFYLEPQQPRRGWMHLYINFSDGKIQGEGTDYVGPWVIQGSYDLVSQLCQWNKQYQGKHRVVYEGRITDSGIQGRWQIHNWNEGPFHIWPSTWTELTNLYISEDLDESRPSVLLQPTQVPPPSAADQLL
jgi:hypothetical protein